MDSLIDAPATPGTSTDVTEEMSLTWDFDPRGNRGMFARLWPVNAPARVAFSRVCHFAQTSFHHSNFIVSEEQEDGQYVGYYGFAVGQHTRRHNIWVFGSDAKKADILLDVRTKDHNVNTGVYSDHGSFFHDQHSATFMIRAEHIREAAEIYLDGCHRIGVAGCMINAGGGVLTGLLLYRLEFTDINRDSYVEQINTMRLDRRQHPLEYPATLTPTPSATSRLIQDKFWVEPTTRGGSYGSVSFGLRRHGGPPVVAKRVIVRGDAGRKALDREIYFLDLLRHTNNVVHFARGFDHKAAIVEGNRMDVTLIVEPATVRTLQELLGDTTKYYTVAKLRDVFLDWASGIEAIHAVPALHRDISARNLGVGPIGVILDLGCTTNEVKNFEHKVGTIPYLAPEVMALKRSENKSKRLEVIKAFSFGADIWSLGLNVALWVLQSRAPPWESDDGGVTSADLDTVCKALVSLKDGSVTGSKPEGDAQCLQDLVAIIKDMLAEDPDKRPTAGEIVEKLGGEMNRPSKLRSL